MHFLVCKTHRKRSSKSAYISKQPADHTYDAMMYDKSTESVQEKLSGTLLLSNVQKYVA